MTGSLLTYARRQSLQTAAVDVNRLLTEFEPLLLRTLGGTIDFEMNIEAPVPRCQADPAHFQSAILNLVINPRDALPDGGKITITSAAETLDASDLLDNPDAQPGLFAAVSVRDTGTGMTPDVLARVFEPFFTTKGVGKGSGLGLSQVFGFTRQSGGHIRLDSTPGNGTTATILLPAVTADHPPVTV